MMSRENARNEWYVLSPDGSSQVIVHDHVGHMDVMTEEASYESHILAGDRFAPLIAAIADGRISPDVTAEEAAAVVSAWDADADPAMIVVERIV